MISYLDNLDAVHLYLDYFHNMVVDHHHMNYHIEHRLKNNEEEILYIFETEFNNRKLPIEYSFQIRTEIRKRMIMFISNEVRSIQFIRFNSKRSLYSVDECQFGSREFVSLIHLNISSYMILSNVDMVYPDNEVCFHLHYDIVHLVEHLHFLVDVAIVHLIVDVDYVNPQNYLVVDCLLPTTMVVDH